MQNTPHLLLAREQAVPMCDYESRLHLYSQLVQLPREAFTRLQYLQPQVGCFNRCAFCSQSAGREVWQFSLRGLRNFMAAFAAAARERSVSTQGAVVGTERIHRPGILFPYLDNDVASYPYLDEYIRHTTQELGVRVRISTVGYSSQNAGLMAMHHRIVRELKGVFAGIRFSFTPYTIGWTEAGAHADITSRAQFINDFSTALQIYRPLIAHLGPGQETACVELRFKPLLATYPQEAFVEMFVDGHHAIHCGPHILVRNTAGATPLKMAEVVGVRGRNPVFNQPPVSYHLLTTNAAIGNDDWQSLACKCIAGNSGEIPKRTVDLYLLSNRDGSYYVADPTFFEDGTFRALHLYPATRYRKLSGYTDATRFFLNALLAYKLKKGIRRREPFPEATKADTQGVIDLLHETANTLWTRDAIAARHIEQEVAPIVAAYAKALQLAGYPSSYFFDGKFTVDTGQIVNQGRARGLFRGLVSREDEPMTPHEERGYGAASISSDRGLVWRIAPLPFGINRSRDAIGGKNVVADTMAIQVQELDPRSLRPEEVATSRPLREFYIRGIELEHVTLQEGQRLLAYPGIAQWS